MFNVTEDELNQVEGNSNVSKVITAAETVNMTWFKNAVNFDKPIDLFLVLG